MPIYWLSDYEHSFPDPTHADTDGLIAVGGDLTAQRLLAAYRSGIFPWYEDSGIFYWFSPDPRFVIFPSELTVHKSMRSIFNQNKFEYTLDTAFQTVMQRCASIERKSVSGSSWITDPFIEGYCGLHALGYAHSVEVWQAGELVAGLYGVAIGRVFCGESMFTAVPNGSKAGLITLIKALEQSGFELIDCQQDTQHLRSLGGRGISRADFVETIKRNNHQPSLKGKWRFENGMVVV